MAKKAKKGSGAGLWFLGIIMCLAVAGVAYYIFGIIGRNIEPPRKPDGKPPIVRITEERKVVLYLPKETKDGFVLVPVSRKMDGEGNILDAAVNALIATNKDSGVVGNLIPQGTRLLSPIEVKDSVASVNLSSDFVDSFAGGSDLEALTLNSIVATVVDTSGGKVKQVRVQVNGKTVDSLGGHMDLTEPLTPDPSIVKSEKGN